MTTQLDERAAGLVSTSGAARLIGVSAETVRLWLRSGRLAHTSTPLGALIRREDVGALIAARQTRERAAAVAEVRNS